MGNAALLRDVSADGLARLTAFCGQIVAEERDRPTLVPQEVRRGKLNAIVISFHLCAPTDRQYGESEKKEWLNRVLAGFSGALVLTIVPITSH